MDANRFDAISKLFASRRLTRREAMKGAGAGIAAGALASTGISYAAAQEATPVAAEGGSDVPEYLFVQSFQSGSIVPEEGADGRFTVTLEQGLGQTIFFTDRPDRTVGAFPTGAFLGWLGFSADNPPNAALVLQQESGETDIAVVELFDPVYDQASHTATYNAQVLADWESSLSLGFQEAPTDLAAVAPSFGAAHLFIDGIWDCPDAQMFCYTDANNPHGSSVGDIGPVDHCYSAGNFACFPCGEHGDDIRYWADLCNQTYPACNGSCGIWNFCSSDAPLGHTLCKASDARSCFPDC